MTKNLESKIISNKRILLLVLNYFIGYMFLYPILLEVCAIVFKMNAATYDILTFLIYLGMMIISIVLGFPVLKESFQRFPKFNKFIEKVLISFVILYFVSGISSSIVSLLTQTDTSANQSLLIDAFKQNPWIISFTILFYAPIVEEILFRGALYRGLRNRFNFVIAGLISGLSFGFIHVFESLISGNFFDLFYLLTYGSLGFLFCYSYENSKTIFVPMTLHFMNNLLGLIGIIVSVYFL